MIKMVKSYVISVSLGTGCYRHIQISATATLFRLHQSILAAFDFEDDHAHAFFMDNRAWSHQAAYFSMEMDDCAGLTKKYKLNQLHLAKGDKFKYIFDFGDEWTFQCRVLRELDTPTDLPGVIRRVGPSPEQYPANDENDEFYQILEQLLFEEDVEDTEEPYGYPEVYDDEVLAELYQQLPLPDDVISCLHDYFAAAARLYGIISLKKLLEIYNHQNPPISQTDFLAVAEVIRHEENDFAILGQEAFFDDVPDSRPIDREIVTQFLYMVDDEAYPEMVEQQANKPYLILPKSQFLCYADDGYYPQTPQSSAMLAYLKSKRRHLKESPEDILLSLHDLLSMGMDLEFILYELDQAGLHLQSRQEAVEFLNLFQQLHNHTRTQTNRGHSPNELRNAVTDAPTLRRFVPEVSGQQTLFAQPTPAPFVLPSKNGPCPCGSGLKYKRCCGKNK